MSIHYTLQSYSVTKLKSFSLAFLPSPLFFSLAESHFVAQAGLELVILRSRPPELLKLKVHTTMPRPRGCAKNQNRVGCGPILQSAAF